MGIPNNLMPYIQQVALGQRAELSVFGSDYPTRDGTCVRDYIHVMDLAEGHVAALDKLFRTSNLGCVPINLGTGTGSTVLEMVKVGVVCEPLIAALWLMEGTCNHHSTIEVNRSCVPIHLGASPCPAVLVIIKVRLVAILRPLETLATLHRPGQGPCGCPGQAVEGLGPGLRAHQAGHRDWPHHA